MEEWKSMIFRNNTSPLFFVPTIILIQLCQSFAHKSW